jgi:hypothetical protein
MNLTARRQSTRPDRIVYGGRRAKRSDRDEGRANCLDASIQQDQESAANTEEAGQHAAHEANQYKFPKVLLERDQLRILDLEC